MWRGGLGGCCFVGCCDLSMEGKQWEGRMLGKGDGWEAGERGGV